MIVPLALLGLVWLSPRDTFVAQRNTAAALNPRSSQFTIALEGGRRSFRPGERIPLVLSYDDLGRGWARNEDVSYRRFADVVLDHTAGTAQPFADLVRAALYFPPGVSGCVEGGVVGGSPRYEIAFGENGVPYFHLVPARPAPKPPPATVTVLLNEGVRFDAPGHYRLYLADRHEAERIPLNKPRPPLISNIVELDITGHDLDWEDRTAHEAIAVLDTSSNPDDRKQAARTLRFLGSRRAIDELARRLFRSATTDSVDFELEAGLFGARDRAYAIARMQAEADDPSRPMSIRYLRDLAALRVTGSYAGPLRPSDKRRALMAADSRWLRTLARAGTLVDRLTATFQATAKENEQAEAKEGSVDAQPAPTTLTVTPALAGFVKEVEAALTKVSPPVQDAVLSTYREVFKRDVRFAPMVERIARRGNTAATGLLNDILPSRARQVILDDLAAHRPRLHITALRLLPDRTLAALEPVFLRQLQTASDATQFAAALDRIERYGTAALGTPTQHAYLARNDRHDCAIAIPALAFFFRTDPAFALVQYEAVRTAPTRPGEGCDEGWRDDLLFAVAARRMSPALEDLAGGLLVGTDPDAAMLAGETLAWSGSPRAKALVWRGLETWQSRWSAERVRVLERTDTPEAALEQRLIRAMVQARQWSLEPRDYDLLAAHCRLSECRSDVSNLRENTDREQPTITTWRDPETGRDVHHLWSGKISLEGFKAQLARYPPGTTFEWSDQLDYTIESWYLDREDEFRRVDRFLRRHGMSLHRR